ncbi:MAG TPA: MBL fold metallo-hydrolase [Candidatus Limiplasma sp.]|nr:MBL fold metallo-hydrolase [Candidatus Limiplasma sp.]
MQFCTLFSGSSGNCAYLSTDRGGVLIDCGMSGKQTLDALRQARLDIASIQAILITHEHVDHVKGAGIISRKLNLPIYATEGTWDGMQQKLGEIPRQHRMVIRTDESFFLDGMEAFPFHIPHDANDPVGYRFFAGKYSVAVATDMGHYSKFVHQAIEGADIVLLESNHDPEMLKNNPSYPARLKTRILGRKGHLSNDAGADAAVQLVHSGTKHILLGHLSPENNTPDMAYQVAAAALTDAGAVIGEDITLNVASRFQAGHLYRI